MPQTAPSRRIDAHLHLTDFAQDTQGIDACLRAMDEAGVDAAVIFGLPVAKEWAEWDAHEPRYYLADNSRCYHYGFTDAIVAEAWLSLDDEARDRFTPMLCGLNPVDRHAVRHVERVLDMYPGVFKGIGELLLRHDDLTNLTFGQPARANHPALFDVYALAAERGMPVLLHQDLTGVQQTREATFLHELVEVLGRFPDTRFVWAHCGASRRVRLDEHRATVETLLNDHPNLFVDYAWVVFEQLICPRNGSGREPEPHWLAMTERFSDRICLGSDLIGRFSGLGAKLDRYDVLLDALSPGAREDLAWRTAAAVYGVGARLGGAVVS